MGSRTAQGEHWDFFNLEASSLKTTKLNKKPFYIFIYICILQYCENKNRLKSWVEKNWDLLSEKCDDNSYISFIDPQNWKTQEGFDELNSNTLRSFIGFQISKYRKTNSILKHKGGNEGRKPICRRIKWICLNHTKKINKKTNAVVGVCHQTCCQYSDYGNYMQWVCKTTNKKN